MNNVGKITVTLTQNGIVDLNSLISSYQLDSIAWVEVIIAPQIQITLQTSFAQIPATVIYVKVRLCENANLSWWLDTTTKIPNFAHYISIQAAENAYAALYFCVPTQTSGQLCIASCMEGQHSAIAVYGSYKTAAAAQLKIRSLQEHTASHSVSKIQLFGIATDQSLVDYEGMITIALQATQSDAAQNFKGLLLSDAARVSAKPALQVHTNEVKCAHGAAIGPLDQSVIHYLGMRGLANKDAQQILVHHYLEQVYTTMPEPLRHLAPIQACF